MALVILASAGCSPGVTTSALALSLLWPRPTVLVDADPNPTQAVLAGYLGGSAIDPGGLTAVAARHRARRDLDVLSAAMELPGCGGPEQDRWFLPGFAHPAAADVFTPVWQLLAPTLAALHQRHIDVFVDVGRLGSGLPAALMCAAQRILIVTRTSLRDIAALRIHLPHLRAHEAMAEDLPQLLVVGDRQPYSHHELSRAFSIGVAGSLADDPPAARVFSDGERPPRRFGATRLMSSARTVVDAVRTRLTPPGRRPEPADPPLERVS